METHLEHRLRTGLDKEDYYEDDRDDYPYSVMLAKWYYLDGGMAERHRDLPTAGDVIVGTLHLTRSEMQYHSGGQKEDYNRESRLLVLARSGLTTNPRRGTRE